LVNSRVTQFHTYPNCKVFIFFNYIAILSKLHTNFEIWISIKLGYSTIN